MEAISNEELVLKYQQGNKDNFNEIYDRFKHLVKFYCRNLFLLGAEQEDLMQEAMFGLINAVNTYKIGEASFKTYATLCIKNAISTAVKKYANKKSFPLNSSSQISLLDEYGLYSPNPEDEALIKESDFELKEEINSTLNKSEIEVLKLYLNGLTYHEISLSIGKTEKAIGNLLSRTRKKLIKRIGEKDGILGSI